MAYLGNLPLMEDRNLQLISSLQLYRNITLNIEVSPHNLQENGQVKSTNKVLENILTKIVATNHQDWDFKLPKALWAYRNTWGNTIGFHLTSMFMVKKSNFPN